MRNISVHSEQIFSKLSGFSAIAIVAHMQKNTEIMGANFEGGVGNKFTPISPQFWIQGAEHFSAFRHIGALPAF